MNKSADGPAQERTGTSTLTLFMLWTMLVLYAAATFLPLFPGAAPMPVIVGSHIIPAAVFCLIHGAILYRLRGVLVLAALCMVIGNLIENLGVATGFPFGHYYFTRGMGPRLFFVPILIGPAYLGMGYLSWTLGRLILGGIRGPLAGSRLVTLPLAASFIMVAWDLSIDPVLSTVGHCWIWLQGGPYFGVPVTNFLGWYLTVYLIYQLFAFYLWKRPSAATSLPSGYWRLAVVFYGTVAAGNILRVFSSAGPALVTDATGAQWKVSDINAASALASILTMGAFTLLAWSRLADHNTEGPVRDRATVAS